MSRIIGLDIGEKRIGVAISDETETIATAYNTINVSNIKDSIDKIRDIVGRYQAVKLVVGLPLNMDGSKGPAAENVLKFIDKLKKIISITVSTFDERLTTRQGEVLLLQADISRKKRKEKIDKIAAQIILQAYLDSKKVS